MALISFIDRTDAHAADFPAVGRQLVVSALGLASTSGWTRPRLSPWAYYAPPADGIWDFNFEADEPHGVVLQVLTPISAAWRGPLPDWCRGVRAHAANNQMAAALVRDAKTIHFEPSPPVALEDVGGGHVLSGRALVEASRRRH